MIKEFDRMAITLANTEREIEQYKEENNELVHKHSTMVTKINTIILELNDVITVLNNKHHENYYFYVYFVKKSLIRGFFYKEFFKNTEFLKKRGIFKNVMKSPGFFRTGNF